MEEIVLTKSDRGLGFSILDYQDPLNMSDTVIVVRSLVPGGVAQVDGRIVPGDRIMYVNSIILHHASLDTAVQALKGKPLDFPIKISIAAPFCLFYKKEAIPINCHPLSDCLKIFQNVSFRNMAIFQFPMRHF